MATDWSAFFYLYYHQHVRTDIIIYNQQIYSTFTGQLILLYHYLELGAIFPAYSSIFICMINAIFDASAGVLLFFKLAYNAIPELRLKHMLIVYAAASGLIWIKTFFFSSFKFARSTRDSNSYSVFHDSPVGRLIGLMKTERKSYE